MYVIFLQRPQSLSFAGRCLDPRRITRTSSTPCASCPAATRSWGWTATAHRVAPARGMGPRITELNVQHKMFGTSSPRFYFNFVTLWFPAHKDQALLQSSTVSLFASSYELATAPSPQRSATFMSPWPTPAAVQIMTSWGGTLEFAGWTHAAHSKPQLRPLTKFNF